MNLHTEVECGINKYEYRSVDIILQVIGRLPVMNQDYIAHILHADIYATELHQI